jgi:N-acetylneuraminic acid mutarotase
MLVPIVCCLLLLLMSCTGSQTNDTQQSTGQSDDQETNVPAAAGQGQWYEAAPLPVGRSEIAVTQTEDAMYVLGGYTPETKSSALFTSYDPQGDVWQELAPLPEGLNHISSAAAEGKVYSFGGFTQQNRGAVASAYEYDPQSDTWTELPSMPTPRGSAAAVALDGRLHVIGGADDISTGSRENVAAHEVYDPATGQWSEAAPLPTPREHMPAVVYDGQIHIVGGRFLEMTNNTGTHEVYNPESDSWEQAAALPTPRSGHAAAVLEDQILIMGGERDPESETGTFEENEGYNPATDSWRALAPLPTPRHGFGAAVFGGAVYAPGGAPVNGGGQQSDANEVFVIAGTSVGEVAAVSPPFRGR